MSKRTVVMDGDIFCYKVAQATMKEVMFDEYVISIGDSAEAKLALDNWFTSIYDKLNADDMIVAFTGPNNFRKEIWTEYKEHRKEKKPYLFKILRDWCLTRYMCELHENLEADDVLGQYMSKSTEYVGVSEDKDLQTVPGMLFNPAKDNIARKIEAGDAIEYFYTQVLTGDTSDGYKGVPGVGPVKAAKYIGLARAESESDYDFIQNGWDTVVKVFEKNGMTYHDAWQNASMAKILWVGEEGNYLGFRIENIQSYWRKHNASK